MDIEHVLNTHGIGAAGLKTFDKKPPLAVLGFDATASGGSVVLSWTNPDDSDFAGVRIQRKIGLW